MTNTSNFGKIKNCNIIKETVDVKGTSYDESLKETIKNIFKQKSLKNSIIL